MSKHFPSIVLHLLLEFEPREDVKDHLFGLGEVHLIGNVPDHERQDDDAVCAGEEYYQLADVGLWRDVAIADLLRPELPVVMVTQISHIDSENVFTGTEELDIQSIGILHSATQIAYPNMYRPDTDRNPKKFIGFSFILHFKMNK